jgi:SAM-dependent MidA family methyltransferase
MEAEPVLRPGTEPAPPESNPDLVALIRNEIERGGPMTFARFMELALYAPELGYYTSAPARVGRGGDFLTAPETHPIFGAAIARQVAEIWRRLGEPPDFAIREYGAGSGALAETVLLGLAREEPGLLEALTYEAVEINPYRRAELADRLRPFGESDRRVVALDPAQASLTPQGARGAGVVLANEFVDAFPVHRLEQRGRELLEAFVDWTQTGFAERLGAPSEPGFAARFATERVVLADGQRAELALGIGGWISEVSAWLAQGAAIVVDYGHAAKDLYGPKRRAGTLLAFAGQRALDDPFAAVGRQDLTAHVDFTALAHAAQAHGLGVLGLTTQARFLMGLGLEGLLEQARSDAAQTVGQYLELRAGLGRLLDPRHTGGFKVLVLGRGIPREPPLAGLAFGP